MEYLIINSENRQWGPITDTTYNFHNLVENTKRIKLLSFTMMNTIFNITDKNNQIYHGWAPVGPGVGIYLTTTIPPGCYSIDLLVDTLETYLNNGTPSGFTFTVSYDEATFKILIQGSDLFELLWTNSDSTMNEVLGYEKVDLTGATVYWGTKMFNLNLLDNIYVHIYDFGVNYNSTQSLNLCTFVIPVEVNSGEMINYKCEQMFPQSISLDNKTLKNIKITLKDKSGQIIDSNGTNYSMILKAKCSK